MAELVFELVYVHDEENEEFLTQVVTNHSVSVEDILTQTEFDIEAWANGNDYDYNALQIRG